MRRTLFLTSMLLARPAVAAPPSGLKDPFNNNTRSEGGAAATDLQDPWANHSYEPRLSAGEALGELKDPWRAASAPTPSSTPSSELLNPFREPAAPSPSTERREPAATGTDLRDPFSPARAGDSGLRDPWAPGSPVR